MPAAAADIRETYENWTDVLVSRLRLQAIKTLKIRCRTSEEVAKVARELRANTSLLELDMSNSDVDPDGAQAIVAAVRDNKSLLKIDLSGNPRVTSESVVGLRTMLQYNSTLFHFGLEGTAVSAEVKHAIDEDLILNSYPRALKWGIQVLEQRLYGDGECVLDFSYDKDDPRTCNQACIDRLARAVKDAAVVSMHMDGHAHGLDVTEVLRGLASGALVTLSISTCGLSDGDVEGAMCKLIRASPQLHHVCLKNNDIRAAGAEALVRALHGTRVQKLCLDYEKLPRAVAARLQAAVGIHHLPPALRKALPGVLANAPRLTHLDLKGSEVKRAVVTDAKTHEGGPPTCSQKHIPEQFNATAMRVLVDALKKNYNVTSIDLSHNAITAEGCEVLAPLLARSTSIRLVDLSCNHLGDAGARILRPVVENSWALRQMDVHGNKISQGLEAQIAAACFRNAMVHSGRVASHAPPRELTHPQQHKRQQRLAVHTTGADDAT